MKLLRVGTSGAERPALLDADGRLRDLSGLVPDIDGAMLADDAALGRIREAAASGELPVLDPGGLRVGPPLARIGKIVCIGLSHGGVALPGQFDEEGAQRPRVVVGEVRERQTALLLFEFGDGGPGAAAHRVTVPPSRADRRAASRTSSAAAASVAGTGFCPGPSRRAVAIAA